jgi:hypothetical protein
VAKLKGPLFSLGASQKLGDTLVYFTWKGLNVVRSHVIPANPKTAAQLVQRGYITACTAAVHAAMADATMPLTEADKSALQLLANQNSSPMTWFNQCVKDWVALKLLGKTPQILCGGVAVMDSPDLVLTMICPAVDTGIIETANMKWGTSPSALFNTVAMTPTLGSNQLVGTIDGVTTGVNYYMKVVALTGTSSAGIQSGIYHFRATSLS